LYVELLIGVLMRGMQAFEWMLAYPEYMNQLDAINGTTKASFYDKASWNNIVTLIEDAGNDKEAITYAMNRVNDIELLLIGSPSNVSRTYGKENFEEFKAKIYNNNNNNNRTIAPFNKLVQTKAILEHNIYKNNNVQLENITELVKAKILIIIAEQGHVVNPIYSKELSQILDCTILELKGDCGHIAAFCDKQLVKQEVSEFLKK
jgi:homoserine O-acetyltransferase